jgi:hypothetical protein
VLIFHSVVNPLHRPLASLRLPRHQLPRNLFNTFTRNSPVEVALERLRKGTHPDDYPSEGLWDILFYLYVWAAKTHTTPLPRLDLRRTNYRRLIARTSVFLIGSQENQTLQILRVTDHAHIEGKLEETPFRRRKHNMLKVQVEIHISRPLLQIVRPRLTVLANEQGRTRTGR